MATKASVTPENAIQLAKEVYGVEVENIKSLPSYDDVNYRKRFFRFFGAFDFVLNCGRLETVLLAYVTS